MDRYDIPPPERFEDFEDPCRDLWALLWDDPTTQKHGRKGQRQAGVDVYGRPQRGSDWRGVQCKVKSQTAGSELTRREILWAMWLGAEPTWAWPWQTRTDH